MLRKLHNKELRAGLCLPGAVCDGNGHILLKAGVCLTEAQFRTLTRLSRDGLYAGDDWPDDTAVSTQNVSSTAQPQETLTAETQDDPPAKAGKLLQRGPYLRIPYPNAGCSEFHLHTRPTTIGRSDEVDIKFADPAVSRTHAVIIYEDNKFLVKDLGSKLGTTVNGAPITSHHLQHDDVIQISQHILQFQDQPVQAMASRVATKAEKLLRTKFRLLPPSMQVEYRLLMIPPEKIFESGDTLRVGRAGLLMPVTDSPEDSRCVEVHLKWPNGRDRFYLGGILGVITECDIHWMCLNLHTVPRKTHELVAELGNPGPWLNSVPTCPH